MTMGFYSDRLLPWQGEGKPEFLQRVTQHAAGQSTLSYNRALYLASQAVATVWNELDGMPDPFTASPVDTPATSRELLEMATIFMAQEIKKGLPALDAAAQLGKMETMAIRYAGSMSGMKGKAEQIRQLSKEKIAKTEMVRIRALLAGIKEAFDAVMELQGSPELDETEKRVLEKLAPLYRDYKDIRRAMFDDKAKRK